MSEEGSAGTKGLSFSSGAAIVTSIGKILTIVADLLLIVAMFIIILSKEDCSQDLSDWDNYRDRKDNPKCCTGLDKYPDRCDEDAEKASMYDSDGKLRETSDYGYKNRREWKCYPTHTHFGAKENGMLLFTPLCFAILILAVLVMALIGKPESFIKYFSFVFTDVGVLVLLIALSFITFPWIKGGKTMGECVELFVDKQKEGESCRSVDDKKDKDGDVTWRHSECSDKYFDLRDEISANCDVTFYSKVADDVYEGGDCHYNGKGEVVKDRSCDDKDPVIYGYKNSYKLHFNEQKGDRSGYKDTVEADHFWAGGYYFGYFPFWASLIAWIVCLYLLVAAILRLTHILKA